MDELVSIIIPVYNTEKYLANCIESVLKQTYDNIQVILIDDGSTDSSGEICDLYAKNDKRIIVIHKKNEGVSIARNIGLMKATGEYIGFVDSDDVVLPDMYATLVDVLDNNKCDMVFCNYNLVDENSNNLEENKIDLPSGIYNSNDALLSVLAQPGYITAIWNKLYRRKLLTDSKGNVISFDPTLTVGEDQVWLEEILDRSTSVYLLNEKLYNWIVHRNSASRTIGITKQKLDELTVAENTLLKYKDRDVKIRAACKVKLFFVASQILYELNRTGEKTANISRQRIHGDLKITSASWMMNHNLRLSTRIRRMIKTWYLYLTQGAKCIDKY